jgi:hypothetical protein
MRPISMGGAGRGHDWRERDGMAMGVWWTGLGIALLLLAPLTAAPVEARNNNDDDALIEARALDVPFLDARAVGSGVMETVVVSAGAGDPRGGGHDGVCAARAGRLPDSVRVEMLLVPRIQLMLERSSTFRDQCRRLAAAPWVHVAVRLGSYYLDRQGYRAYSTIQRPQKKLLVAVVTLQASAEPALWIGHEFEHLIEQIDDVDVSGMADRLRGAWHTRSGMVETGRAVRVGVRVFDEVRTTTPDNLVD